MHQNNRAYLFIREIQFLHPTAVAQIIGGHHYGACCQTRAIFALMFYPVKTPSFFKLIHPNRCWDIKTSTKTIFLTFDDGPHPTITPFVLNLLNQYNAKATFFCIGNNVAQHPEVYAKIIENGHSVGNHTYRHTNGWKTENKLYLNDIEEASAYINSNLFRPPYGRLKWSQAKQLSSYKIIMWDVLSGDFDNITPEKCIKNVVDKTKSGSIVVFHDSEKAFPKLEIALPEVLSYFSQKEYILNKI